MKGWCRGVAVLTSFMCPRRGPAVLGLQWPIELHRSTGQVVQHEGSASKFCAFESFAGEVMQCWD